MAPPAYEQESAYPQQAAYFDTGNGVSGPHDPQPVGADDELAMVLQMQAEQAALRLKAHKQELAEQTRFHEAEIERLARVQRAVESASRELQPPGNQEASPVPHFAGARPEGGLSHS